MIHAPRRWIMRFDLTDEEWALLEPLMPKARKSARADHRKIMNAIFYVLRTGMPWRDLPERYGPYTTAYNRFNRWSRRNLNRQGRKPTGSEISVVLKGLAPVHPGAKPMGHRAQE